MTEGYLPGGGVTLGLTLQKNIVQVEGCVRLWLRCDYWRLFDYTELKCTESKTTLKIRSTVSNKSK